MKQCTLTFDMWLHYPDEECPYIEERLDKLDGACETCKWYKEI